ncbi:PDGLE domain-containing protein [Paenibacillus xylaniclasticus]|uniref:PDGLE domain-containing protein n=1 Tax=Paenibacillus xylaniclasticus TaxID=588083 RepID=UPI000FDA98E7|nr:MULTISPECIES: PDGLE domain-containing protein [Paenibacillus]GFN33771.1 hypothetical protein PCURB6_40310 [Paenibacillus curdlanolyticus]
MKTFRVTAHRTKWIVIAIITVGTAVFLSPWASSHPDGLERVAEDHGFLQQATAWNKLAPLPDYEIPSMKWTAASVGLTGFVGIVVMAGMLWGVSRLLTRNGGGRNGQSTSGGNKGIYDSK